MKTEFTIEPNILKAIATFVSKDETRYVLNGVAVEIEPDAVVLVATDGRKIGALKVYAEVEADAELPKQFIIPRSLIASMPKTKLGVRIEYDGKKVGIYDIDKGVSAPAIEGRYPEWRKVMVDWTGKPFQNVVCNIEFLADFAAAHTLLRGKGVALYQHEENGVYSILFYGVPEFIGGLMPMRWDAPAGYPAWLVGDLAILKKAEQAAQKEACHVEEAAQ